MNITFPVKQKEAFLQGINASSSTVKLEITPSDYTEEERRWMSLKDNGHEAELSLFEPSPAGLRERLDARHAAKAEALVETRRKTIEFIEGGHTETVYLRVPETDEKKKIEITVPRSVPHIGTTYWNSHCFVNRTEDPELEALVALYETKRQQAIETATAAALASDEAKALKAEYDREEAARQAAVAKRAEREAAAQAEYEAEVAKLREIVRQKYEQGFLPKKDLDALVRAQLLAAAGLAEGDYEHTQGSVVTLSDEAFGRLQRLRSQLGELANEAEIAVREWTDLRPYRKATDDDDYEDIDSDGEVARSLEEQRRRIVATVEWSRAGLDLRGVVVLDTDCPDEYPVDSRFDVPSESVEAYSARHPETRAHGAWDRQARG